MGVNTAQTNYAISIHRHIYNTNVQITSSVLLLYYRHNTDPAMVIVNSTAGDPTLYRFYSSHLNLYVENFSVPSPQDVREVEFVCEFSVVNQGMRISAETATAVIPGFCKFWHACELQTWLHSNCEDKFSAHDKLFNYDIPVIAPPVITASLDNITVIPQGSNYMFVVQVYSHPPSRIYWWQLNNSTLLASDPHFVMEGPLISGNTSNFSLAILHARYVLRDACICKSITTVESTN